MGCCSSNLRRPYHTDITLEERQISAAERHLFFTNKKIEDLLFLIESIDFPFDLTNFPSLCELFKIQATSPSGIFLHNLLQSKTLSSRVLRHLSILLSEIQSISKFSLIFSLDKKGFLNTIQDILHLSLEVIPKNLENVEKSVLVYTDSLKPVAEEYLKELRRLSIDEIREKVEKMEISSKELRYMMYVDLKHTSLVDSLDAKFEKFGVDVKIEGKIEVVKEKIEDFVSTEEDQRKFEGEKEENKAIFERDEGKHDEKEFVLSENRVEDEMLVDIGNEVVEKEKAAGNEGDADFNDKVPDLVEDSDLKEESLILPASAAENFDELVCENLLEDPKPENSDEKMPVIEEEVKETHENSENKIETGEKVEENKLEADDSVGVNISTETGPRSKIPVKKSSGLATKIKATQSFLRSSTLGSQEKSEIKIGLSSSQKKFSNSKIETKLIHEDLQMNPIPLDSSLSESSVLRSSIKTHEVQESPSHKESKIGYFKSKK